MLAKRQFYMKQARPAKFAESLRMLDSKEGQLNAVFACYGSAMQHGQLYEQAVDRLLSTYSHMNVSDQDESAEVNTGKSKKQTLGQLLHTLFKGVKINDTDVHMQLMRALDQRNMLAHEYFLTRDALFTTETGRLRLVRELVTIEQSIRSAMHLVSGMRVAIEEAMSGKDRDIKNSKVLFTMDVKLNSDPN